MTLREVPFPAGADSADALARSHVGVLSARHFPGQYGMERDTDSARANPVLFLVMDNKAFIYGERPTIGNPRRKLDALGSRKTGWQTSR
jgi:hypothetical protein